MCTHHKRLKIAVARKTLFDERPCSQRHVYEPTRFNIGIMLYSRATECQRGDQVELDMACYPLVVPHRAIRAGHGAVGDKDSKNSRSSSFFYCSEIRHLDVFIDAILWRQCNRSFRPEIKLNHHRKSRLFLRGELRSRLQSRLRQVDSMRALLCFL